MTWMEGKAASLGGSTTRPAQQTLKLEVLRSNIQGAATMKLATLVVRASLESEGTLRWSHVYRGQDASMNWSSGEQEVQAAFDGAYADLARQLDTALAASCQG